MVTFKTTKRNFFCCILKIYGSEKKGPIFQVINLYDSGRASLSSSVLSNNDTFSNGVLHKGHRKSISKSLQA